MIILSPSLLSADFLDLNGEIKKIEKNGADFIHLDIMDGSFVPNISFGLPVVCACRRATGLVLDTHLMIEEPVRYVKRFSDAGSDIISFQYESTREHEKTLNAILAEGKKAGMVVSPKTDVALLEPFLDRLYLVLVMSVEPGFGGQKFIPDALAKISYIKNVIRKRSLPTLVEVDGGITLDNAPSVIEAGADILVAGSSIFCGEGTENAVRDFKKL